MAVLAAEHVVFLSVGSNLGNKADNCRQGIAALDRPGTARVAAVSRFFRTSPVDYTQQAWFVNAAVKLLTPLTPLALLERLLAIQRRLGRTGEAIRFGPRVLDLDILFYDDRIIRTARLEIPHPRLHKRAFVLQPICDIDPTIRHPVLGKTVAELLTELNDDSQRVIPLDDPLPLSPGRWP